MADTQTTQDHQPIYFVLPLRLRKSKRLHLVALDKYCPSCHGVQPFDCDACDGVGRVPTAQGAAVLALMERYGQ